VKYTFGKGRRRKENEEAQGTSEDTLLQEFIIYSEFGI
jgi:hypothetical protein